MLQRRITELEKAMAFQLQLIRSMSKSLAEHRQVLNDLVQKRMNQLGEEGADDGISDRS